MFLFYRSASAPGTFSHLVQARAIRHTAPSLFAPIFMAYPTVAFTVFFTLALLFLHASRRWLSQETAWILLGGIFYGSVHPWLALFLWVYASVAAVVGKRIETTRSKTATLLFVAVAVGLLALTKYANWGLSLVGELPLWPQWAVPASLSFITFQAIWAVLQSYRGEATGVSLRSRIAHICFFPSLSSGPIVALTQWKNAPIQEPTQIHEGLARITMGLFQKLVLASVANIMATTGLQDPSIASSPLLWQSVLAYSFEIYFDFAGYSNMAIGVALMMGMRLPENFRDPYFARSIQDFWRRWHISLSTFFRDNLYIGLFGGNRNGMPRQMLNAVIIMAICGLWHGANTTYIVWGLLHGGALAGYVLWKRTGFQLSPWMSLAATFAFVTYAWIWFRAPSLQEALTIQHGLWKPASDGESPLPWGWWFLTLCALWLPLERRLQSRAVDFARGVSRWKTPVWGAAIIVCLALAPRGMPSFIYYQF